MIQAKPKVVFMFWAPGANPAKHRTTVFLDSMELTVVGVRDYNQAVEVAQDLVKEGVTVIELCAGFGNVGAAKVAEAAKGVPVGVVRFDIHPAFQGKSGDQVLGLAP